MIRTRGQMPEAVSTGIFLTLSGGFQDAYTDYGRGAYVAEHVMFVKEGQEDGS